MSNSVPPVEKENDESKIEETRKREVKRGLLGDVQEVKDTVETKVE